MREMKNSGIEWIGDIPSDWKLPKVKKLFKIGRGRVIAVTEMNPDGKYPVFSSQTKNDGCLGYIDTYDFDQDQLTWTTDGANAGTVFLRRGKHNCTNVCGILLPYTNDNDLRFLKYSLEYIAIFHKRADINGFKIMNNEMADIVITLPPLSEQIVIADFLDEKCAEIDTVIEKTKATIEEYKKLKQSVITQAVTKGIRPNRPMKDSGIEWIGEIPADWSVRKLKTFTTQISKGATPKDMSTEKTDFYSIRFLKSENIVDNQLMSVPEFYIEESIHSGELKRSQLSDNDIMFVIAGASIGKVAIVSNELLPANTNQAMSFIRVLEKYKEIKKYLWYVLQSDIMKLFITLYSVQSAQPNISMENLGNFRLCVPADFQEIKDILLYLNIKCLEIDELIAKKTSLLSELESYKKSLIYEYVTGKKEV